MQTDILSQEYRNRPKVIGYKFDPPFVSDIDSCTAQYCINPLMDNSGPSSLG